MIAAETLNPALIRSLTAEFERRGHMHAAQSAEFSTGSGTVQAARWAVSMADYDDPSGSDWLGSLLETAADQLDAATVTTTVVPAAQRPPLGVDAGATAPGREPSGVCPPAGPTPPAMLVMDVDSTLIDQEVIDLLAAHAGRQAEVAEVTERAMRGELDFTESLHARVATLGGLPESVLQETFQKVTPTSGARELISAWRRRSWPVYAVSGGFVQILAPLAAELGLTGFQANTLELAEGQLTGRVTSDVVDRSVKQQRLLEWAQQHSVPVQNVVAVGDGANDLDMVRTAGMGVAFCAKPALAEQADLVIRHRSMELISYALGLAPDQD